MREEKKKSKGVTDPEDVARRLLSRRGVIPYVKHDPSDSPKAYMEYALQHAKKIGLVKAGDRVVGVHDVDDCAVMKIVDIE